MFHLVPIGVAQQQLALLYVHHLVPVENFVEEGLLQDLCLQSVGTTGFGYVIIAFSTLYRVSPVVAAAPILVLAISVHFVIKWTAEKANREMKSHKSRVQSKAATVTQMAAPAVVERERKLELYSLGLL